MIEWHTDEPPKDGWYLVTVRSYFNMWFVSVDRWEVPIGFVEWHDDVLAWAILPEPWKGEKNEQGHK